MKNIIILILLTLPLIQYTNKAAEPTYFYSPGIKYGYQFGDNGGTVFGFEISLMRTVDYFPNVGGTICFEFFNDNVKLHLGAQTAQIIGIDIGPTINFTSQKTNFGYSFGVYGLAFVMPFYEYTKIFDETNYSFSQSGIFLKAPIPSRPYRLSLSH